jgi:8-oxo-dGTP pyrophosphatase MutT (NUDIX family)
MNKGTDCIGITVVYFCHNGKGKVIMGKRNANTRDEHGRWDIGGGGLEFGEKVDETLVREIKEEYCTNVIDHEFLGYRDVHRIHNGQPTHWIALDFAVLVEEEPVAIGEPHKFDAVEWFDIDNLPSETHSQFPTFYELYSDKLLALQAS